MYFYRFKKHSKYGIGIIRVASLEILSSGVQIRTDTNRDVQPKISRDGFRK